MMRSGTLPGKRVLDDVRGCVSGRERDGDHECGGRKTQEAKNNRLPAPPRQLFFEDGNAALAMR
jgi:hypothetical protein